MNNKKFIVMLSCLTAAFCILIVVYNFASMPPYGADAASAVALYNSSSQQSEDIQGNSETDNQTSETDNAEVSSSTSSASTASTSKSTKKSTAAKTSSTANSTVNNTGSTATSAQNKATAAKTAPQSPVNINTASLEQIETIPYIGAVKAQAIIDYRSQNGSFTSVDGLDSVKGIGAKTIDKIRSYVTVG